MENRLQNALHDIVAQLEKCRHQYALIGALATSIQGRIRATDDIDLVVLIEIEDAIRFLQIIDRSLFDPLFSDVEQVVRRSLILPLQHKATKVSLDLAVGVSGFEQQLVARSKATNIGGSEVRVATPEDLVLMKIIASRPQDTADVEGILAVCGTSMDWQYCTNMAEKLEEAFESSILAVVKNFEKRFCNKT